MAVDLKNASLMRQAGVASVAVAVILTAIKLYAFIETGSVSMLSTLFDSALDFGAQPRRRTRKTALLRHRQKRPGG